MTDIVEYSPFQDKWNYMTITEGQARMIATVTLTETRLVCVSRDVTGAASAGY